MGRPCVWLIMMTALAPSAALVRAEEGDWMNSRESYLCKSSDEVREIRTYVRAAPAGSAGATAACRVDYLKGGVTRTLWSAHGGRAYCVDRAAQLLATLEASHFACQRLRNGAADE